MEEEDDDDDDEEDEVNLQRRGDFLFVIFCCPTICNKQCQAWLKTCENRSRPDGVWGRVGWYVGFLGRFWSLVLGPLGRKNKTFLNIRF